MPWTKSLCLCLCLLAAAAAVANILVGGGPAGSLPRLLLRRRQGPLVVPVLSVQEFGGLVSRGGGGNDNIFFVETDPSRSEMHAQCACAVESAARENGRAGIFVVLDADSRMERMPKILSEFANVHVVKVDFRDLVRGTPVESLFSSDLIRSGPFALENASDALRLALLLRFGGVYLDSDVVSKREVPEKDANFLANEFYDCSENLGNCSLANSVMKFEMGHPFLLRSLQEMSSSFTGRKWAELGSDVLNRLWKGCHNQQGQQQGGGDSICGDIAILPPKSAFPVFWKDWIKFFLHVDDKDASEVLDANGGGGGFAIHLYNHMKSFARKSLSVHRSSLMHRIFRQFCPRAEEVMLRPILGKEYQP